MNHLISKWQHVLDRLNIATWTEVLTLCYLAELAHSSCSIIECGTYTGASAKVMLIANPTLNVTCIDTFECKNEPMMDAYPKNMTTKEICEQITLRKEIEEGRCRLIVGNSEQGSHQLSGLHDAIWIDDGHSEDDLRRDIRCLMPLLKSGGEMVGHDFDVPHNDVARGVISTGIHFDVPIPRMWRHVKT